MCEWIINVWNWIISLDWISIASMLAAAASAWAAFQMKSIAERQNTLTENIAKEQNKLTIELAESQQAEELKQKEREFDIYLHKERLQIYKLIKDLYDWLENTQNDSKYIINIDMDENVSYHNTVLFIKYMINDTRYTRMLLLENPKYAEDFKITNNFLANIIYDSVFYFELPIAEALIRWYGKILVYIQNRVWTNELVGTEIEELLLVMQYVVMLSRGTLDERISEEGKECAEDTNTQ